jgi:hypothetical protein
MTARVGHRFGMFSLVCGASACLLFLSLAYLGRLGQLVGGNILTALDRLGLVSHERTYIVEMKSSSVFSLNDANAVIWITWLACVLGIAAVALAFFAEYKRESTLYLSAGFVVATASSALLSPLAMLLVQTIGAIAIIGIMRRGAIEI